MNLEFILSMKLEQTASNKRVYKFSKNLVGKGQGKVHPRTGKKVQRRSKGTALLLL